MTDTRHTAPGTHGLTASVKVAEAVDQLRHILAAVAVATRPLVPFDRLGLALVEDGEAIPTISLRWEGAVDGSGQTYLRHQWSDRLWPRVGGAPVCIRDAAQELDASCDVDRAL